MKKIFTALAGSFFLLFAAAASAAVKPSALFTDHMVLQRDMEVPVWGTAEPGEAVKVSFSGQTRTTTAGADGKWMVRLARLKASGPFEMEIQGTNLITLHDVLVGEVWLATGQSNMVFTVSKRAAFFAGMLDEDKEIAAANYPQIRMFTEKTVKAYTPQDTALGDWKVCSPDTVGAFSAIGYLFARDLQQQLHVPVGIVTVAFGASTAESWLPREAFAHDPQLQPLLDRFDARETYFKDHPHALAANAPPAPLTLNARSAGSTSGPLFDPAENQHEPTVMFNGMLHPVIPYAVRGTIWYQGESIVGGSAGVELYPHVMDTLVTTWRALWGEGDFPFYAVQLAALKNVSNNPVVREQQAKILSLPNTGLAITIDVGDPDNVHPKDKEPVGRRLALIALAKAYGRKVEYSGPVYTSMKVEGDSIHIRFAHIDGGLAAKDGPLHCFQIAGADRHFVDADAVIQGDTVVVKSAQVPAPAAVRYAWDNYPEGANLYNADNLPAAPFRTDDWDALSAVAKEFTGQ
ncbi:MAG TPA: sialate O-acetylesterase [Terracidiphilus sp.]|jgi:sialate O-acetylesterase|nr:sialate O-acetylesterase [Terracidiphilus sp.]